MICRGFARPSSTTAQASPQISFAPPAPKRTVAAERQFARPAVELAVTPFHRVNAPAVPDRPAANRDGLEQRREVVAEAQVDSEPRVLGLNVRDRLVFEEGSHLGRSEVRDQRSE